MRSNQIRESRIDEDLVKRFIDLSKDLELVRHCHHEDVNFKLNDVFLYGYDTSNVPIFIKILHIFKQDNALHLLDWTHPEVSGSMTKITMY